MPTFTMELWRAIDLKPKDKTVDEWLGLNDYPLFDGIDREALNNKIKNHYMYQEIGHETISQFSFSMRRKMHEIMPVYNELYKSAAIEVDILSTIDMRSISKGTQEQTSEASTTNETESDIGAVSKNVSSSFPSVMLSGNKDYATSGADANSQTKTKGESADASLAESAASNENESHTTGYQGNPSQLIQAFRAAIINVDMLIIAELDDLFMMVWNNGDDYSQTKGRFYQ